MNAPLERVRKKSLGERISSHPLVVLLAAVSGIVASVGVVFGWVPKLWDKEWPDTEYEIVRKLDVGVDLNYLKLSLGDPARTLTGQDNVTETVFMRPGYWVQVYSNSTGIVNQWTVIACDRRFKPTFTNRHLQALSNGTLGRSHPQDISPAASSKFVLPASNGPTYEEAQGGGSNAESIQVRWGADSSCADWPFPRLEGLASGPNGWDCPNLTGCEARGDNLALLRQRVTINAWSECVTSCRPLPGTFGSRDLPFQQAPD